MSARVHDLRSDILDRITGNAHRIAESAVDASTEREAQHIVVLSDYLATSTAAFMQVVTTKSIPSLFHFEHLNELVLDIGKVDLHELLNRAADITSLTTASKRVAVFVPVGLRDRAFIRGDRAKLLVAIVNIFRNSKKYAPPDLNEDNVQCSVSLPGPRSLSVQILDRGLPMPLEVRDVLFQQPIRRRTGGGTGHGCFVAGEIIRAHGGDIQRPVQRLNSNQQHYGWAVEFTLPSWNSEE